MKALLYTCQQLSLSVIFPHSQEILKMSKNINKKIACLDIAPKFKIILLILIKTAVRFIIPVLQVKTIGAQRHYVIFFPTHRTSKWQNGIPA